MKNFYRAILFLLIYTLFTTACHREETQLTPSTDTKFESSTKKGSTAISDTKTNKFQQKIVKSFIFMKDSITLSSGETIADALPIWRHLAAQKPTLLLLSSDPALQPSTNTLQTKISEIMTSAADEELRNAGNTELSDPLFQPAMSVDLAIQQGWLNKLVWAFPQRNLEQEIKLETLRDQLTTRQLVTADEAATLQLVDKVYSGRLRNVAFQAGPLPNLPQLEGPLLVHIDLSYLQGLYKNEITTPVIPMVDAILQQLKERNLQVLAVTLSYNHTDGNIPLKVRFIGELLTELIKNPELKDQPLPRHWKAQHDILYLENFFQNDEIDKLVERQEKDAPKAAWVKFNRYYVAGFRREETKKMTHLAAAVGLDRMYGLEYLSLAQQAIENKMPNQALQMLKLACATFPEQPLIKLQTAEMALEIGDKEMARTLIKDLQSLSWSPFFHPNMPQYLQGLLADTKN